MFDQLLDIVKQQAQSAIVNNDAVPNQHNDAAINEAGSAIQQVLSGAVANGNLQDVMSLFSNGGGNVASNPLVGNIVNSLAGNLASKYGVDSSAASSIASSLIPQVLSQFTQKTADPNDSSVDMNTVISSLTGGKTGGVDFNSVLSQFSQGGGQGVDIAGIAGQLLSNQGGAGGLLGTIAGMFGKK
ncbi:MAG: hypothetical protein KA242_02370 [Chitinophagales bacterium]|jgi:hypothetical protein|nr:hypothetical protein [Chitinophagales bacterium]